jgi:nucleotide-binding universal stress UspA family protein
MYRSILLTVDLNAESSWKKALPVAVALAKTFGAKLHLMNVVPTIGSGIVASYFPEHYEEKMLAEAELHLERFAKDHIAEGIDYQVHLAHGSIYREVMRVADAEGCDLIVMASHRPELADYLLGPNAERVVRHANQSVMVVRN